MHRLSAGEDPLFCSPGDENSNIKSAFHVVCDGNGSKRCSHVGMLSIFASFDRNNRKIAPIVSLYSLTSLSMVNLGTTNVRGGRLLVRRLVGGDIKHRASGFVLGRPSQASQECIRSVCLWHKPTGLHHILLHTTRGMLYSMIECGVGKVPERLSPTRGELTVIVHNVSAFVWSCSRATLKRCHNDSHHLFATIPVSDKFSEAHGIIIVLQSSGIK